MVFTMKKAGARSTRPQYKQQRERDGLKRFGSTREIVPLTSSSDSGLSHAESSIGEMSISGNQVNGPSFEPVVANPGKSLLLQSSARNLTPDHHNSAMDIFIRVLDPSSVFLPLMER